MYVFVVRITTAIVSITLMDIIITLTVHRVGGWRTGTGRSKGGRALMEQQIFRLAYCFRRYIGHARDGIRKHRTFHAKARKTVEARPVSGHS